MKIYSVEHQYWDDWWSEGYYLNRDEAEKHLAYVAETIDKYLRIEDYSINEIEVWDTFEPERDD